MAATEGVGAAQRDDLLVVEAHPVEDLAEVVLGLGSVREAAVGSAGGDVLVAAAWSVRDVGAQHLLDGYDAAEDPEIGIRDPREFLCFPLLALGHWRVNCAATV